MKQVIQVVDDLNELNCKIALMNQVLNQLDKGATLSSKAVMGFADMLAGWECQVDSCIIVLETYKNTH